MDVNNKKSVKESVFLCPEEFEAEKLARSPKSACSCSPNRSPTGSPPSLPERDVMMVLPDPLVDSKNNGSPIKSAPLHSFAGVLKS